MTKGSFETPESGSPNVGFRTHDELTDAFWGLMQTLNPEESISLDPLLNVISRDGVTKLAELARRARHPFNPPFEAAIPSEVIEHFRTLETIPPIVIKGQGSVDEELIKQLGWSRDNFKREFDNLLEFIELDRLQHLEISVLDLPEIQKRMLNIELRALERIILLNVLDEHGIYWVFDVNDPSRWSELKLLVSELASEHFRDYSISLREKKQKGEWTPMLDVAGHIEGFREIRQRALNLAMNNANAGPAERARLLDGQPPYMRPLIIRYFQDLDGLKSSPEEDREDNDDERDEPPEPLLV